MTGGGAHVTRDAEALDAYIVALAVGRLSRPDAADLTAADSPDLGPLHVEANGLQVRLEEAARLYADGVITAGQLTTTTARLLEHLADVHGQLASAAQVDALAGLGGSHAGEVWESLPLTRQRAVVDTLMRIVVLPRKTRGRLPGGGYFDPESVQVEWRTSSD
jgi:hypothetical protein